MDMTGVIVTGVNLDCQEYLDLRYVRNESIPKDYILEIIIYNISIALFEYASHLTIFNSHIR